MHGNFDGHVHKIECIHTHPAGAIGLLLLHFAVKLYAAVKHTDIIQTKKATFEHIIPVRVFPVDPPGEIDNEF